MDWGQHAPPPSWRSSWGKVCPAPLTIWLPRRTPARLPCSPGRSPSTTRTRSSATPSTVNELQVCVCSRACARPPFFSMFIVLDISHLPRLWQCGVPVCNEQRHHRVSYQRTRPSYCLYVLCGGLFPHGRQPSVCARNSRDDGGRWVEKFNANCEPLIVCKYSQRS